MIIAERYAWGITSLADYWQNTYFDPVLDHNGVDKKFDGYWIVRV